MSELQINDYLLTKEAESIAEDIRDELDIDEGETLADHLDDAFDRAHEWADGHQWVIYHHTALMLCAHCDTSEGEQFLEDVGMPGNPTFYGLASMIAYGELRARIETALQELADEEEN